MSARAYGALGAMVGNLNATVSALASGASA